MHSVHGSVTSDIAILYRVCRAVHNRRSSGSQDSFVIINEHEAELFQEKEGKRGEQGGNKSGSYTSNATVFGVGVATVAVDDDAATAYVDGEAVVTDATTDDVDDAYYC